MFEDNGKFYIKAFLLDSSVNKNSWGVDPSTLEQNIQTYIGKPLVLQDNFDHPNSGDSNYDHNLQYQEKFRIGNIIDIVQKDGIYSAVIEVTDQIAKDAFKAGNLPLYVSPQIFHDGVGSEPDASAKTWRGTHLAIVREPAFGIVKARVEGQCSGSPITCLAQLKKAAIEKTKCNCVKQAIANYKKSADMSMSECMDTMMNDKGMDRDAAKERCSKMMGASLSSLVDLSTNKNKLTDSNDTKPQIQPEEFEKIRLERDELKAKVASLEGVNNKLQEENKTVSASLDSLKGEYRKDKVASLLSNVFYKTDEERAQNIETFTKSGMTYEEIERVTSPLKKASVDKKTEESKLQVKSAASEESSSDLPYWVQIEQSISGARA